MKKENKNWEREWIELVHNGACCAFEDPNAEKKEAFIKALGEHKNKQDHSNKANDQKH